MTNKALMQRRAEALAGRSPRQAGLDKARQALDWVYRWGYSAASVLDGLSGAKRRGLSARLVKQGLLKSTRTESGGTVKGVPQAILTLTPLGLSDVERWREYLLPYELDAYRYRQDQLRHYMLAQMATAKAQAEGLLVGFSTEKELSERSAAGVKQPDVLWNLPTGQKVGIEIELSAKWGRDLDTFVLACLKAISKGPEGAPARFDMVAVVSDSPAILKRYKAAFEPGANYGIWQKDERSRWEKIDTQKVPTWAKGRVQWRQLAY